MVEQKLEALLSDSKAPLNRIEGHYTLELNLQKCELLISCNKYTPMCVLYSSLQYLTNICPRIWEIL